MRDTVLIGLLAPVFATVTALQRRVTRRRIVIGASSTRAHHGRTIIPGLEDSRARTTERAA